MKPEVLIPAIAGLLGAILVCYAAFNTARVARASNDRTAKLEEYKTQLNARDELLEKYRSEISRMNDRVNRLDQDYRSLYTWARAAYRQVPEITTPPPFMEHP